jgi:hypothetical protein
MTHKTIATLSLISLLLVVSGCMARTQPSVSTARETDRDGRFIYSNGTVLDTRTNLMWAAYDNRSDINWYSAKSYCEKYRGGGYTDWRMPTQDELAGLYDEAKSYTSTCGYTVHVTELIHLTCHALWASETGDSDAPSFLHPMREPTSAALFSFYAGGRYWGPRSSATLSRALPVRSGK